jgi:hypothetical protein
VTGDLTEQVKKVTKKPLSFKGKKKKAQGQPKMTAGQADFCQLSETQAGVSKAGSRSLLTDPSNINYTKTTKISAGGKFIMKSKRPRLEEQDENFKRRERKSFSCSESISSPSSSSRSSSINNDGYETPEDEPVYTEEETAQKEAVNNSRPPSFSIIDVSEDEKERERKTKETAEEITQRVLPLLDKTWWALPGADVPPELYGEHSGNGFARKQRFDLRVWRDVGWDNWKWWDIYGEALIYNCYL